MKDGTIIKELLQYLAKLQQGKLTLAQITPLAYCIWLEVDFTFGLMFPSDLKGKKFGTINELSCLLLREKFPPAQ